MQMTIRNFDDVVRYCINEGVEVTFRKYATQSGFEITEVLFRFYAKDHSCNARCVAEDSYDQLLKKLQFQLKDIIEELKNFFVEVKTDEL